MKLDPFFLSRAIRRKNAWVVLVVLIVLLAVGVLDQGVGVLPVDDDWHRYHGRRFEVVRVIDGDTLDLRVTDGDEALTRVRLWGVDTPELHTRDPRPAEPWAEEALAYSQGLVEGRWVTLRLQPDRLRGGFGRLLAYVQTDDGVVLNAGLIEEGLSSHDDRWGHDASDAYEALEQQARRAGLGMWSE